MNNSKLPIQITPDVLLDIQQERLELLYSDGTLCEESLYDFSEEVVNQVKEVGRELNLTIDHLI